MFINLKGVSVGSGFFDPITQLNYAEFYYGTGLLDEEENQYFEQKQQLTRDLIQQGNWSQAFIVSYDPLIRRHASVHECKTLT